MPCEFVVKFRGLVDAQDHETDFYTGTFDSKSLSCVHTGLEGCNFLLYADHKNVATPTALNLITCECKSLIIITE